MNESWVTGTDPTASGEAQAGGGPPGCGGPAPGPLCSVLVTDFKKGHRPRNPLMRL